MAVPSWQGSTQDSNAELRTLAAALLVRSAQQHAVLSFVVSIGLRRVWRSVV